MMYNITVQTFTIVDKFLVVTQKIITTPVTSDYHGITF